MVRETGEGESERERRVVLITAAAVIQSLNALRDVSCQNAYKIQLCDERGHSGHLCFV